MEEAGAIFAHERAGADGAGGPEGFIDDAGPGLLGIQEAASQLGVTHRTLRFYEDKGLIEPQRVGNTRIYSRRDIGRMQLILRGKKLGFTIREIKEFLDLYDADPTKIEQMQHLLGRIHDRLKLLQRQRAALDKTVAELKHMEAEAQDRIAELQARAHL